MFPRFSYRLSTRLYWLLAGVLAVFLARLMGQDLPESLGTGALVLIFCAGALLGFAGRRARGKGCVIWFTGLPSSGKSTLADLLASRIKERGILVERLDGDQMRSFFPETGYTRPERCAHLRRAAFIAQRLERAGAVVICSFVSPYEEARAEVRRMCVHFIEVYLDVPLEECERRDVKGLYRRARSGALSSFTGIDDPYETPAAPELRIAAVGKPPEQCVEEIEQYLRRRLDGVS